MERFGGDRVNTRQMFDEVQVLLQFLDDQGDLVQSTTRLRKRDGSTEWTVWLFGVPRHVATVRSTHAYLSGAADIVIRRDGTRDPRLRM